MPRKPTEGCEPIYIEVPIDMKARLVELAERNHRGLKAELLHAFERHLAAPPTVTVVTETPPMPVPEIKVKAGDEEKRGPGRPPGAGKARKKAEE